jgi:hypothetical protein
VGPSSLLAQRAVADDPRWTRAVEDNPTVPSGISKSFLYGREEGSEEGRIVKGFRGWFMNYGLVLSILVSTALVAVLAYRLEGSRWRWPMVALALAGVGTAVGILWLRRFIDRQPKAPDQGGQE